jgi:CheY-like chemotaxis protein
MIKILFCEDDDLTRKLIRIILRDVPYMLFFASDGLEGLTFIEAERPDIVFTDLHMQGLDGNGLCAAIRGREDLAHLPVILMTGAESQDTLLVAEDSQDLFTDRLAKPFSPAALHGMVDRYLQIPSRAQGSLAFQHAVGHA